MKMLFVDGSKNNELRFYLNDIVTLEGMSFMEKLKEVDYRDTYCDMPFLYHEKLLDLLLQSVLIQEFPRQMVLD